ncbi:sporulation protein YunB [Paenibacillus albicereus]|uniref:Sporulation protein YunB n=2 Tax=Paenibacillus albicereus TaxID=2726185 RepID=A0A6H2H3K3_9BACL|nr:sporulation protein YunB [Paenibacillus albicereus]
MRLSRSSSTPGSRSAGRLLPSRPRRAAPWAGDPARPRQRRRRRRRWVLLTVALLLGLGTVNGYFYLERKLQPPLMRIAQLKVKQIMTEAINKAITDQVASDAKLESLIDWKMDASGKVSGFMMNYNEHMKITAQTIQTVQHTLQESENFREGVPIGQALDSALLASFGPRVPIRFEPIGDAKVELSTRQKDAGINMILVEVYMRIHTELSVVIPFNAASQTVDTEIPISYLMVVGDVPMYYYDGKGKPIGDSAAAAPALTLPPPSGEGAAGADPGGSGANGTEREQGEGP